MCILDCHTKIYQWLLTFHGPSRNFESVFPAKIYTTMTHISRWLSAYILQYAVVHLQYIPISLIRWFQCSNNRQLCRNGRFHWHVIYYRLHLTNYGKLCTSNSLYTWIVPPLSPQINKSSSEISWAQATHRCFPVGNTTLPKTESFKALW